MSDQISQTPTHDSVKEKVFKIERELGHALECTKTVDEFREQYHKICEIHGVSGDDNPDVDFFDDGSGCVSQSMVSFVDEKGEFQTELITALGISGIYG